MSFFVTKPTLQVDPCQIDWIQLRQKCQSVVVCDTISLCCLHLCSVTVSVCSVEINGSIVPISHLWNNLFTPVWLNRSLSALSCISAPHFPELCCVNFSSQPLPQAWLSPELDMPQTKIWWTRFIINFKVLVSSGLSIFRNEVVHFTAHLREGAWILHRSGKHSLCNALNGLAPYTRRSKRFLF